MKQRSKPGAWLFIAVGLCGFAAQGAQTQPAIDIERGTLGGSVITIATPANWNHQVLLYAHGLRDAKAPLTAEIAMDSDVVKHLLAEGWMLAITSYRRNGFILNEAVDDMEQLRAHIIKTHAQPQRIYIEGTSMGGAIATLMSESGKEKYDGVLCIGAIVNADPKSPYQFSPRTPMIFLSNQNEIGGPSAYINKVEDEKLKPALWEVKRDGHCNTTSREEEAALRALFAFRETGKVELRKDATQSDDAPVSTATFHDGGASAIVARIDPAYGNITTCFVATDLAKLGIGIGRKFTVTFNGKTFSPLVGTSYYNVPRGEWTAFMRADGYLLIARNFDNAAKELGCKEKDELFIKPVDEAKKP